MDEIQVKTHDLRTQFMKRISLAGFPAHTGSDFERINNIVWEPSLILTKVVPELDTLKKAYTDIPKYTHNSGEPLKYTEVSLHDSRLFET